MARRDLPQVEAVMVSVPVAALTRSALRVGWAQPTQMSSGAPGEPRGETFGGAGNGW